MCEIYVRKCLHIAKRFKLVFLQLCRCAAINRFLQIWLRISESFLKHQLVKLVYIYCISIVYIRFLNQYKQNKNNNKTNETDTQQLRAIRNEQDYQKYDQRNIWVLVFEHSTGNNLYTFQIIINWFWASYLYFISLLQGFCIFLNVRLKL